MLASCACAEEVQRRSSGTRSHGRKRTGEVEAVLLLVSLVTSRYLTIRTRHGALIHALLPHPLKYHLLTISHDASPIAQDDSIGWLVAFGVCFVAYRVLFRASLHSHAPPHSLTPPAEQAAAIRRPPPPAHDDRRSLKLKSIK